MWRWNAILVGLFWSLTVCQSADAKANNASLLAKSPWIRVDLVLGRLTASKRAAGQGHHKHTAKSELPHEVLSIDAIAGSPRIRYERTDDHRDVRIEIVNHNEVVITKSAIGTSGGAIIHYQQRLGEPVELAVSVDGRRDYYRHQSLWHLFIAEPEISQTHLVPILQLIQTDWRPVEAAARIEDRILATAKQEITVTPQYLTHLIRQLDDPAYSQRQAADREIVNFGVGVLPALRSIETNGLSPEQQMRLQRIQQRLVSATDDTPLRVAVWLANDPIVWLGMLEDQDAIKRAIATNRLERLRGESISFDPGGSEPSRRRQIARLRETWIRR